MRRFFWRSTDGSGVRRAGNENTDDRRLLINPVPATSPYGQSFFVWTLWYNYTTIKCGRNTSERRRKLALSRINAHHDHAVRRAPLGRLSRRPTARGYGLQEGRACNTGCPFISGKVLSFRRDYRKKAALGETLNQSAPAWLLVAGVHQASGRRPCLLIYRRPCVQAIQLSS
jgi:hypothetical protein